MIENETASAVDTFTGVVAAKPKASRIVDQSVKMSNDPRNPTSLGFVELAKSARLSGAATLKARRS